jgi:hypothetical protein
MATQTTRNVVYGDFPLHTPDYGRASGSSFRFRYGYICRLIDDNELRSLPAALRAKTRQAHKAAYWKSVSLLRRDAETVLKLRREKMAAKKEWDFQTLLADYTRVHGLVVKLAAAGLSHSIHLGAGLESARAACREFELLLTPSIAASAHAATM